MVNFSESTAKGTDLRIVTRVKTGSFEYTRLSITGKPFFHDDLLSQKDLLPAINAFMQQEVSAPINTACRGIVLVGELASIERSSSPQDGESSPTITPRNIDDKKSNSLWERRKAKAEKENQAIPPPSSPPNVTVSTPLPYSDACPSGSSSVHSSLSEFNSAYPPMPHSATSVSSSMSNNLPSIASPSSVYSCQGSNFGNISPTIVQTGSFVNLENSSSASLASVTSSAPSVHDSDPSPSSQVDGNLFQPYETDNTINNWNFSEPEIRDVPQADFTLMPHMFPQAVAQPPPPPQAPAPYAVPSPFYVDSSKIRSVAPVPQPGPEVYDMNALQRLQLMGQQPLPAPGIAYPAAYPHSAPTAFGYKYNDMMSPMNPMGAPAAGGYFMGAPQGNLLRPGMRGSSKRKVRYGAMGMGGMGMGGNMGGSGFTGHMCAECHAVESPEWRKGPKGPKTLCNACGLRWAKRSRKESQKNKAAAAAASASEGSSDAPSSSTSSASSST